MGTNVRTDRRYDWVGPADKISRIRSIKLRRVEGETPLESEYRQAREILNQWNSDFWTHHNQLFEKNKAEFVASRRANVGKLGDVSANDMSVFYKNFLDQRHSALMAYNQEWYRRNLSLIWPALKVNMVRFRRLLLRR